MRVKLFLLLFIATITSVYCSAQENAVPEPVLEGLRQQMKQLDTLQANYNITSTTYPSNKELRYEVSCIKSGDKYNMHELTYDGDEQIREERYVYDEIEIKFFNYTKQSNLKIGSVHTKSFNNVLSIENDICRLSGFNIIRPDYERNLDLKVYKNLGKEIIDRHECEKILSIVPYKPPQNAYIYYWIETRDDKYFLIKTVCLIEDDPGKLLYEKRYDYNYSDKYPIPRTIDYKRFEIDNNGNRTPEYNKSIAVKDFEANVPVSDSEFVYFFPEGTMVNTTTASINPETLIDPNNTNKEKSLQNATEVNLPATDNRTEFHIDDESEAILIPIYIQDKEYLFLVDTGTSNTILDASLRDFLGKPKKNIKVQTAGNPVVMQVFESPLIQIGSFNIPKGTDVSCVDLNMLSMIDGRKISGILGMDFLAKHIIRVDFDKDILSFLARDNFNITASGHQFDLIYISYRVPQIRGQLLDNTDTDFVIDSGCNYFGELEKDIFEKLVNQKETNTTEILVVAASGSQKKREIRAKNLKIGDFSYKDTIFGEGNSNRLGLEFLNRHIVTFDFPEMKMYLNKSDQFEQIDEDDMSGLHLLLISGRIVVHSIDQDSPADKNGITSGDIILKVNGKSADSLAISQIRSILKSGDGKEITLSIEHNGQSRETTLVLERKI